MDYKKINKASWNKRTATHVKSEFYDLPGFLAGKNSLNSIELDLLGEIANKSILHLQCHFGQDSLSLARMGADVTGVDLSDAAIDKARELNDQLGLDAAFICCDLYEQGSICPYVEECSRIDDFQRVASAHCTLSKFKDIRSMF